MAYNTKVSLKVALPGRVPFSKQECFENSIIDFTGKEPVVVDHKPLGEPFGREYFDKKGNLRKGLAIRETAIPGMTDKHSVLKEYFDKKLQKKVAKKVVFFTRKCQPAYQVIRISQEAYDAFIDNDACPVWYRPEGLTAKQTAARWKLLSGTEKLEINLQRLAEGLGGTLDSYEILPD